MNPLQQTGLRMPSLSPSPIPPTSSLFDEDTQKRIEMARQAGIPESQIQMEATEYQARKSAMPKPEQSTSAIDEWLPTIGSVVGGIGGGLVAGPAGAIAGAGLGGGAGEAFRQTRKGQDLNLPDIALQGGLGAIGEGIGGLVAKGAGKLLSGAGKSAVKYGDELTTKGLNLTSKMESDVVKKMGEKSLPEFLGKRGLQGADYERVAIYTEPIQAHFDSIAENPNIKIDPNTIVSNFQKSINELRSSILPSDRAKAEALEQIQLNFIEKFGDQPIGADVVTQLRRSVDKGVKDFGADPVVASTGNITRNVLQDTIQQADSTGSLKETGAELNKLYTLLSKAEPRQFANQAKAGLNIGGKDAISAFLGSTFAGPAGAGAGLVTSKLLSTQTGNKVASGGFQTIGKKLEGMGVNLPPIGGAIGTATATSLSPRETQQSNSDTNSNNPQNLPHIEGTLPQTQINSNTMSQELPAIGVTYITGHSPERLYKAMLKAQSSGDKTNASVLRKMYEDEIAYQKENKKDKPKPLSAVQQTLVNKVKAGVSALDRIESDLAKDSNVLAKRLNPLDQSGRAIDADIESAIDVLGFIRTGATLTEEQRKAYRTIFPSAFDSEDTKKRKLKAIRAEFEGLANPQSEIPDTNVLPPIQ